MIIPSIDIIVTSTNQENLDKFLATIGIRKTIHVLHKGLEIPNWVKSYEVKQFGNIEYNLILREILKEKNVKLHNKVSGYFGIFNDDIVFSKNWLEEILKTFGKYDCISPGYVETIDMEIFKKAQELTKNEVGIVDCSYGPCALMKMAVFPYIGMLDEQYKWGGDDLDLEWRLRLNGFKTGTLKKVLIAHTMGASRATEMKRWNIQSRQATEYFWSKHGVANYRHLKNLYAGHQYFKETRNRARTLAT